MAERDVITMDASRDLGSILRAPASPAVRGNGLIFTSGYMSIDPATGDISPGSIEHETELTLENLRVLLGRAGATFDDVLKVHVFLTDIDQYFQGMNAVYERYFRAPMPARRTIEAKLVYGLKVEIEFIARDPR